MTAPSIKEALERSIVAIDDWLNVYASELCNQDRVDEANHRISNAGGTLAYIANVQQQNRAALATLQPSGERREAIARIIDPDGFCVEPNPDESKLMRAARRHSAFEKADLILTSGLVQDEAGWRDINTAPKDGTEILLFTHHEADEYLDESFDAVQIGWWDDGNHAPGSAFHRDAGWHQQKIGSATHWMPLPMPPIRSARWRVTDTGRAALAQSVEKK